MPIIEGRSLVLPRDDGQFDIAVIQKIEHIATVGNKEEADRVMRLINGVGARAAAPAPTAPVAERKRPGPKPGAKRGARKAAKKVGAKKVTRRRRARRAVATAAPAKAKSAVDVSRLAGIVEEAVGGSK